MGKAYKFWFIEIMVTAVIMSILTEVTDAPFGVGMLINTVIMVMLHPNVCMYLAQFVLLLRPVFGVILYLVTAVIGFREGPFWGIGSLLLPGISTLYWSFDISKAHGTVLNPYVLCVTAYAFLVVYGYTSVLTVRLLADDAMRSSEQAPPPQFHGRSGQSEGEAEGRRAIKDDDTVAGVAPRPLSLTGSDSAEKTTESDIFSSEELRRVDAAEEAEDWVGMLNAAQTVVRKFPDHYMAWFSLGSAYALLQMPDDAATAFSKTVKMKQDFPYAWLSLGSAYARLHKYDDAVTALTQAITLKPDYPDAWWLFGMVYGDQGKYDDAIAALREAIKLKPDYPDAWRDLGMCYSHQGRNDDAVGAYQQAIQLKPEDAQAWYKLGLTYAMQGKQSEARDALDHLRKLDPSLADELSGVLSAKQAPATEKAAQATAEQKRVRILCLDDEPVPLLAYKCILQPLGYEVLTTRSSTEALRIMRAERVDLLIQDLSRPDINGIELYGMMKADERLQNIPVVVCSGYEVNRSRFQERYPEVAAVMGKPFEVKYLVEMVRRALRL